MCPPHPVSKRQFSEKSEIGEQPKKQPFANSGENRDMTLHKTQSLRAELEEALLKAFQDFERITQTRIARVVLATNDKDIVGVTVELE